MVPFEKENYRNCIALNQRSSAIERYLYSIDILFCSIIYFECLLFPDVQRGKNLAIFIYLLN